MSVVILGPTGEFPEGKIDSEDEGELTMAIGAAEGLVRVDFGSPVVWIAMGPDDARGMAASLVEMAERAEAEQA